MAYVVRDRELFLTQLRHGLLGAIYDGSLFAEVAADLVDEGVIVETRRESGEFGWWSMYARAPDSATEETRNP